MTEETVLLVSEMLIASLKRHGFDCIGTFYLKETTAENELKDEYQYGDTETGLNDLERLTRIPGEARAGLEMLVKVTLQYFLTARSIPTRFEESFPFPGSQERQTVPEHREAQEVLELQKKWRVPRILLGDLNDKSVDLTSELGDNKELDRLIDILFAIQENIDLDDEEFFNVLDRLN
ncbi:MAG TPA: hypothetical protein VI461_12490 [Chitinophagaceae bacterium]|nr:hypothetical protein [Chitinophagaceae bacterium]